MKLTSSSTARRRTAKALLRSLGGPQMPSPVRRMAPKPRRCTEICPPSEISPAKLAESSFLFMIFLQYFFVKLNHTPALMLQRQRRQSRILSALVMRSDIAMSLAKPLWISVRAIEAMARFIKLELSCFRGFCRFRQKLGNLGRVHRLKTPGSLKRLLQDRERIAGGDSHTRRKTHRIVKAFDRGGCFAL